MEDPCVMVPAAFLAQEYLRGVEPSEVTISMSSSPGLNMVKKGWQLVLLMHAFLSVLDAVHTSPPFISGWLSLVTSPFQFHPVYCLDLPGLLFLHEVFGFCFSLYPFRPFLLAFLPPIIKVLRWICLLWFFPAFVMNNLPLFCLWALVPSCIVIFLLFVCFSNFSLR